MHDPSAETKTAPSLDWVADWPLPSWLMTPPTALSLRQIKVVFADGASRVGELESATLHGLDLTLDWRAPPTLMVMPWAQLRSVTRMAPLVPNTRLETDLSSDPNKVTWDARINHQLIPFRARLAKGNGGKIITGQCMGCLPGAYGLFLYVEQPNGQFLAEWVSAAALDTVEVGRQLWRIGYNETLNASAGPPQLTPRLAERRAAARAPDPAPIPITSVARLLVALDVARTAPLPNLERILLDLEFVTPEILASCATRAAPGELLNVLRDEGVLSPKQLQHALSRLASLPEVDLRRFQFGADCGALDISHIRRYQVCPLGATADCFYLATANPTDQAVVPLLSALLNKRVQLVWAAGAEVNEHLAQLEATATRQTSPAPGPARKAPGPSNTWATDADVDALMAKALADVDRDLPTGQIADIAESSNFVLLVRRIIEDAQRLNASDIHIETNPGQMVTRVRFRRDGDMEPYRELPAVLRGPLVSRIKVMARLDISEHRRAQDGKINFTEFGGHELELRVAVLPTHDGLEDVVLRLLASGKPIALTKLGLQTRDESKLLAMSARSFGLILAAGPTGSGKTTTLHSLLKEVNTDQRKIWTAEDPIEITQEGLRQVQVNPKIGVTFASAMRAFLRADPDIIMIGEIRDDETAKIAIEASLTGHLVLSTLHTNSASESVVRLLDLGMDPMNFADSLIGIVAQRLVRALCQKCALSTPLTAAGFDELLREYIAGSPLDAEEGRKRLTEAAAIADANVGFTVKTAVGCPNCNSKGYKGRMGIYEVLQNTPAMRELIQRRARPAEIFAAAIQMGMRSLRHDALEKLLQGRIDLRQARVAYG